MRKRFFCVSVFLFCLIALCACNVSAMSSLSDISRPYTGEYQCEKLFLGSEDLTENFEYIKLALGYGGDFKLSYRDNRGREGGYSGEYSVSEEKKEITFKGKVGLRNAESSFPMEKGAILIDFNFRGKLLHAEFRMP